VSAQENNLPKSLSIPAAAAALLMSALLSACPEEGGEKTAELPPAGLAGGLSDTPKADSGPATPPGMPPMPESAFAKLTPETVILTVGTLDYSVADHEKAMIHQAAMLGAPPGQLPPQLKLALEAPAYRSLEKRGLLFGEAVAKKLAASDAEVKAQKDKLLASMPEGRKLEDVLKAMRTTEEGFLKDLKTDMSIGKLMQKIYAEQPKIDDKRAKEIYDKNPERYQDDSKVTASHILLTLAADAPPAAVEAASKKASELLGKVKGKDAATFAKVAKESSEDPGSKDKGGALGSFSKREMLPTFSMAAFALEPGQVSDVVRTEKGLHIIRVEKKEKGSVPFAQVKERIVAMESLELRQKAERELLLRLEKDTKVVRHHLPAGPMPPLVPPERPAGPPGMPPGMPMPPMPMPPPGAGGMPGGGPGGPGGHPGMPLPSADNVRPGAANPHGGGELKLDPSAPPDDLQLKLKPPGG
jgi:peptidyl-prolyl cis-trans isomerase C